MTLASRPRATRNSIAYADMDTVLLLPYPIRALQGVTADGTA